MRRWKIVRCEDEKDKVRNVKMIELRNMTYGIVGLGIMGGSIAQAIRANVLDEPRATGRILACDVNAQALAMAKSGGVIDEAYASDKTDDMLKLCDLVYICLYPHATLDFLAAHKAAFKTGAIVTDISGVKAVLVEGMQLKIDSDSPAKFPEQNTASNPEQKILRSDVDFILGHPMAGGAKEGYVNASGAYFANRNYILLPQAWNKKENLELMRALISAMGFTRIVETDYHNHDHKIAFTSQLCHVIASALVESAEDERITEFGGGSFEDLTRIAMINAPLWTELFLSNRKELLGHLNNFENQLDEMKQYIEKGDAQSLESYLEDVRKKRMSMGTLVSK